MSDKPPVTSDKCVQDFCAALGFDAKMMNKISKIVITLEPQELVKITVTAFATVNEIKELTSVVSEYTLVLDDDTRG